MRDWAVKAYTFKVHLQWDEPVRRTIEVTDDFTLDDLHVSIQKAFGWDNDHLYSFYLSGRAWDKKTEYVDPRGDNSSYKLWGGPKPRRADKTSIAALGLRPGRKFLYIFDFGDEWHHGIELLDIRDADPAVTYPRIVDRVGDAPDQYPRQDEEDDDPTRAETLRDLGELSEWVPKIRKAVRRTREQMEAADYKEQYVFAMDLYEAIRKRDIECGSGSSAENPPAGPAESHAFGLLDDAVGVSDMADWLIGMPLDLAHRGMAQEGARLAKAWSELMDPKNFLGDRAVILGKAGLEEEARAQVRENLERFPDDAWIQIKAGDAYRALTDMAAAESQYRKSLEMAQEGFDRDGVLERFIPLLREIGKIAEAENLEADARKQQEEERTGWESIDRKPPKVGRNEPCPCGSGKKFKKCCLGKAETQFNAARAGNADA